MSRRTVSSMVGQVLVGAALAVGVVSAHADSSDVTTIEFGALLSGTGAPTSANFAQLTVRDVGGNAVFTLKASNLALFNGSTPFLGSIALELEDDVSFLGSVSNVSGGVSSIDVSRGGGPGGDWDLRFDLGKGAQNRLTQGETVTWTWVGGAGLWDDDDIAAHVQGISYGGTTSAWYRAAEDDCNKGGGGVVTPSVVPEPASAALYGLGVVALGMARRRRSNRR